MPKYKKTYFQSGKSWAIEFRRLGAYRDGCRWTRWATRAEAEDGETLRRLRKAIDRALFALPVDPRLYAQAQANIIPRRYC